MIKYKKMQQKRRKKKKMEKIHQLKLTYVGAFVVCAETGAWYGRTTNV